MYAVKALNLGADRYLNKNGSPESVYGELAYAIKHLAERKQSRELLKISESKYRLLVEKSLQGIMIAQNNPLRIAFANVTMGKMLGYKPEEFTSFSPAEVAALVHHEDRVIFFSRFKKRFEGKEAENSYEFRAVRKDGSIVWMEAFASEIEYNGQPAVQAMFLDIDERKKTDELIKKSEARFRELANFLPEIVFETDLTRKITFFSQTAFDITGYTPAEVEKGLNMVQFVVPEDRERAKENIRRRMAGEKTGSSEYTLFRKNGDTYPAIVKTAPIFSENNLIGLRGLVIDISEREKAEEALADSEAKYRALVQNADDTILLTDLRGKHIFRNHAYYKSLGYEENEKIDTDGYSRVHPDDLPKMKGSIDELLKSGSLTAEYRVKHHDGSWVYRYAKSTLIYNKLHEPYAILAIIRDVTEYRKAEQSLVESEEKFRKLAEESPNMIFISLQGRVVYANKKCVDKIGYTKEEFYSPNFNFLSIIAPESVELLKSSYGKHMSGEDISPYEYILLTRDSHRINAIINSKLIEYNGQKAILGLVTDISEQKKNEALLRQNEEQFRQLFSSMPSGVAVYEAVDDGEDFVFRDFNFAAEKIEKISKNNVIGKRLTQVFSGVKSFGIFEVFQRVWRTGRPEYFPSALYKGNEEKGSWRENWVYKLPNGNIVAIYNEITDRIETDVALRQEREKLESVTASIDAGLVIVSKDYHILWENEFIRRYKGNVNGKLCYATLNTLDSPCHDCGVAKIFEGKTTSDIHEYCSTNKDGQLYWVEIIASPIRDEHGKVVAASELVIDITKRKQVEQELQERNSKFSALFGSNPEAAVFLDPDFHIVEANSRFCALFGYSFDELKGKVVTDLIVPIDSKEESKIVRQKVIQGPVEIVTTRIRKDGSQIPLLMSGGPVFVNEKLIGSVMVYKDFTDILAAEEELNKALIRAELLNEKLRVVGSLTRHDVRNKLSSVAGYAYILKKKCSGQADIVERLDKIEQAVDESVKLFEFAKIYEQIGVEELTYINVEAKISEAIALLSGPLPKINNECQGLTVLADSVLRQMFYNLIDNTRKYGKKTTNINIHYEKTEKDCLKLIYEDNGVGISLENKPRLFKEGFSTGSSTGFGLFLTKKMIDVYGWEIEETGEPGKGAKFSITIPKLNKNGQENFLISV